MNRTLTTLAYILLPIVVVGGMWALSRDVTQRNREYPTQMGDSPASRSQTANPILPKGGTDQPPVAGTIPRGSMPFHYATSPEESIRAGKELTNPFEASPENIARGKYVFDNNCVVCHGATGMGDGPVIPKYPNPPSYKTDTSRALRDGELFYIITRGRLNMPPHESQVSADDRWKLVLYIRQLQAEVKN